MDYQLLIVLALLAGVLAMFLRGGSGPEWAALAAFAALPALGVLELSEAATVFTAQAPLTIAMMFVMSAALERTGCVEVLGAHVSRLAGRSYLKALLLLMGAAMLASAAMNNTPVVIVMTPLALGLAKSVGVNASRLLMPLSFAAILGGSATLIGASANVLVSDSAASHGAAPFGMFEMTGPGLIFAAVGLLYMLLIGRHLLPDRTTQAAAAAAAAAEKRRVDDGPARQGGLIEAVRAAFGLGALQPAAASASGADLQRVAARSLESAYSAEVGASREGAQSKQDDDRSERPGPFAGRYWLELFGQRASDCEQSHRPRKAPIAVGIVLAVMLLAALGVAPIVYLALGGAVAAWATGCVCLRDAARAVDWRLIAMIFGMLGLSLGLEKTGAVAMLAEGLIGIGAEASPIVALLVLYAATSVVTSLVTNNAVALMMAPVALAFAQQLNVDPRAFLMAVMFAASASFATPIGYQTNMIVYRAGGYRFTDFLVVGLPLNILFAGLACLILPWFFPF